MAGLLAALFLAALAPRAVHAEPAATGARLSLHPGFTRLTVDLTESAAVEAFLLEISDQVVVRLPEVEWRLPPRVDAALGSIAGFSAEPAGFGAWRLLIDVNRSVVLRRAVVEAADEGAGFRLVVELADPDLPQSDAVRPSVAELVAPINPFLPPRLTGPRTIVIDPGHGGRDPGASGIAGAVEKDIVLAAALALRDALEANGDFRVLMTREDDSAMSLSERTAFALAADADLFVSVHADAYHSSVARGTSVYSLSSSGAERGAAALSRGDGRETLLADIGYGDQDAAVGNILLDMMMDVTIDESARLAELVVEEVGLSARLLDNSHRMAGYHVLKMPHTPAILVELGYLSNAIDATDLQDAAHRQVLADAIARGIVRFLAEGAPLPAVPEAGATLDMDATQRP
ncbi:MAG: N-acetylmuramoyl-L-alanine amidase [Alphaproteobacteria bacterium]